MKKLLSIILVLIIVLTGTGLLYINYLSKAGLPDYNANINLKGLSEDVTVFRDKYGIPHIYAKNENDLYLTTGYLTAQDRMWQMDLLRRVTQGRMSEIFGENLINSDVLMRSLRIREKSELVIEKCLPEVKKNFDAYTRGINLYLEDNADNLPFEFTLLGYKPDKWQTVHSFNIIGYMSWDLKTGWYQEVALSKIKSKISDEKFKDLIPDLSIQNFPVHPNFELPGDISDNNLMMDIDKIASLAPEPFKASNNWAVAGKKSTTGKPIIANDMHLGLTVPGVWSQIHQSVEGGLNVTGFILPGQPYIISGHNDNIAWALTNVSVDHCDFYVETINPNDSLKYKLNGEWKDIKIVEYEIEVKDMEEPVKKRVRFTHRGPIVSEFRNIKDKTISLRWAGNEYSEDIYAPYFMNRAKNWDEFRIACSFYKAISQNIAYADIDGNIGMQTCAGVPIRKGLSYSFYPGDTDEYDWKGFVPFDSLPYTYNPECGYVLSANQETTNDKYPYYISKWFALPYRARRIEEMLTEKEKLSPEDFMKIHTDQKSLLADDFIDIFITAIEGIDDLTGEEKHIVDLLKKWDKVMGTDKPEPLIFEELYYTVYKNIVTDELGEDLAKGTILFSSYANILLDKIIKNGSSDWCDDVATDKKETFTDMIQKSFKETVLTLNEKFGTDYSKWKWGDTHKVNIMHPLGRVNMFDIAFDLNREYSIGGSYHTVSTFSYSYRKRFEAKHGVSQRSIYNTADFDKSYSVIPTGVSGIPGSNHYCDQTKMLIKGYYHIDYTSKEIVKNNAVYKMVFKKSE